MVAGGGASVVYSDAIAAHGFADELANYGEYSGAPSEGQTYEYAKTIAAAEPDGELRHQDRRGALAGGGSEVRGCGHCRLRTERRIYFIFDRTSGVRACDGLGCCSRGSRCAGALRETDGAGAVCAHVRTRLRGGGAGAAVHGTSSERTRLGRVHTVTGRRTYATTTAAARIKDSAWILGDSWLWGTGQRRGGAGGREDSPGDTRGGRRSRSLEEAKYSQGSQST